MYRLKTPQLAISFYHLLLKREICLLKEISKTSFKATYGSGFYDLLSLELKKAIPNCKGLNHQSLRYAERFYTLYKKIFPQVVEQLLFTIFFINVKYELVKA